MARQKIWGDHGTVARYRQGGCDDLQGGIAGVGERCAECKLAMSEYNRNGRAGLNSRNSGSRRVGSNSSRAGSNSGLTGSNSSPIESNSDAPAHGPIGMAILSALEEHRSSRPVEFEVALACARILDAPERVTLHPTTIRQLNLVLDRLAGRKSKTGGRLEAIKRMTEKRTESEL